jgi:hypothetical protein
MYKLINNLKRVFFPENPFSYLGAVPWNKEGDIYKKTLALVLLMDYKARPFWCPRWFLRLTNWLGNDNSIVRVKYRWIHNLHNKITHGVRFVDYKTKWHDYDLRLSIYADGDCNWLEDAITEKYYRDGYKLELIDSIKKYNPEFNKNWETICEMEKYF